jgi:SAM-dependent methyltransferase
MPQDHHDPPDGVGSTTPTAADFDRAFSAAAAAAGVRRVWRLANPDLPTEIEPFSFVSADLLRHVARALDLSPGQTLADLGCGRGGPGLWLAQQAGAALVGVDFSPVAVDQAAQRAVLFGLAGRARFVVGHLARTGLPRASAGCPARRPARRSPVPAPDSRSLPSGHRQCDRPRLTARSRNPAVTARIEIKRVSQLNFGLVCYIYFEKLVSASEGVSR